jgi:hypothetical protein
VLNFLRPRAPCRIGFVKPAQSLNARHWRKNNTPTFRGDPYFGDARNLRGVAHASLSSTLERLLSQKWETVLRPDTRQNKSPEQEDDSKKRSLALGLSRFPFECYRLIPGLPFGHPPENHLRDNMIKTLAEKDVGFEIRVQVQTDPFRMPIEARKTLPARTARKPSFSRQKFDSPARFEFVDHLKYAPGIASKNIARSAIKAARV